MMKYLLIAFAILLHANVHAQENMEQDDEPQLILGHFEFEHIIILPGTPEQIYDAVTGDISGWWDHKFSKNPYRFYIEPVPGGGFWEIFDESGDGAKHAEVIVAQRGKLLRLDGPFGLSGRAIHHVVSYYFSKGSKPNTCELRLVVHAAGAYEPAVPEMVEKVWFHFLFERLQPYVEAGKHLK